MKGHEKQNISCSWRSQKREERVCGEADVSFHREKEGIHCYQPDDEMRYRVILHRQRRPADWRTFEVMHGAGKEMGHILEEADAILFDCITMYVNNILMDHMKGITVETLGVSDLTTLQQELERDLDLMFDRISSVSDKEIIFVSDELGMGIVPANAMSRVYRDLVGLANQYVAKRADRVYLSIAGITMELKERGVEL